MVRKNTPLRIREPLMVRIICGATKAAVHVDRRKQSSKRACRSTNWKREEA